MVQFRTRYERRTPKPEWVEVLPEVPMPSCEVILVAGCPGAGKSTYVASRLAEDDLIIDIDRIKSVITGKPPHQYDDSAELTRQAIKRRNTMLHDLSNTKAKRCWFVCGAPTASERRHWRRTLGCSVVVVETPLNTAAHRIESDPARTGKREAMRSWAASWWERYARDPADSVVQS